ncbi:carbon-nitrogen family hydrolase [Yinghuangia soli]|uniref:Carbon-nitrogen family hydrolase n=1 Tax=Yinghuangia soli TaxID=2908204 RepID=A0AA41TYM4_9ACTN|nr:carbon-nitrogen family hydrolase [Yinghuangia soli]MCF2526546.1 carbon-nitrogen family hydrolase [Yinghuangia soli]
MRVSLIQLEVDLSVPAADRLAEAAELVRGRAGDHLVVLPELWLAGGWDYARWDEDAEALDGPTARTMADAARDAGVWLHAGSIVELGPDGAHYNTSLLIGPDGLRRAAYRKIHRFGFDSGEAALMGPGDEIVTCPTPFGTIGLATCYDLRFPEMFRLLLDQGTEVLVVPAAWPARRVEHWRLFARARAVENQVFVLACNTAGEQAGLAQGGHSMVVDPWGEILAEAGTGFQVLTAEIDTALVAKTRADFPVLKDRRLGR